MKIHEYQAKEIFRRYDIPVPKGTVVESPSEARLAVEGFGGRAVLKAQVHAGGRGKAGGVVVVQTPSAGEEVARSLLEKNLVTLQTDARGVPVRALLVEELANIHQEGYLAITVDPTQRGPVALASASGGMEIEEVAATDPAGIHTEPIDPLLGIMPFQTRRLANKLQLDASHVPAANQIVTALYRLFVDLDCSLVEINP